MNCCPATQKVGGAPDSLLLYTIYLWYYTAESSYIFILFQISHIPFFQNQLRENIKNFLGSFFRGRILPSGRQCKYIRSLLTSSRRSCPISMVIRSRFRPSSLKLLFQSLFSILFWKSDSMSNLAIFWKILKIRRRKFLRNSHEIRLFFSFFRTI